MNGLDENLDAVGELVARWAKIAGVRATFVRRLPGQPTVSVVHLDCEGNGHCDFAFTHADAANAVDLEGLLLCR